MLRTLSLFSGIGAFEKALTNLNVEYETINFCEFDKYAVESYCTIHNVDQSKNLGDITKVDENKLPKDLDLITYGFPCQDISVAGKGRGFEHDGTKTRSGLFFDALRIIEAVKPKIAIAENVKNLTGKKFKKEFDIVLASLEEAGYNNYWQVLNAKDYGIPQNRERVFIISIRKDIDTGSFQFPQPFPLEKRLKDMLEENVDERFYLSEKAIKGLDAHLERNKAKGNGFGWKPLDENEIARTIKTECGYRPDSNFIRQNMDTPIRIGNIYGEQFGTGYAGNVWDKEGISPALMTMQGGGRQPHIVIEKGEEQKVLVKEATAKGYAEAEIGDSINLEQPNSKTRRGRVGKGIANTLTTSPQQAVVEPNVLTPKRTAYGKAIRKKYESGEVKESRHNMTELKPKTDGVANTLTTVLKDNWVLEPVNAMPDGTCRTIKSQYYKTSQANYKRTGTMGATGVDTGVRIRKLTPKECWRLMGFSDEDCDKASKVVSNSQLYKQAGNSIVVDVLEELFCMMLDEEGCLFV